ncbi:MAG TPA: glycosyltransferase [Gemmatimonadaceae bacterium]|nr:glycosyltransferase [Gemmatimonadaceae bacterium]
MTLELLALAQAAALAVVLARLASGRGRVPRVSPIPEGLDDTSVTVMLPTLDEGDRVGECLAGLRAQGPPLMEILVVDSNSTDGTRRVVEEAARSDPRVRLLTDPPLPPGWIGKVWALQYGLGAARGEWVLGVDADTVAERGMIAAAVHAARSHGFDLVSFGPRFSEQSAGERWLQPAMLATLVYRSGPPGVDAAPDRVLANGQCFLARRALLSQHGGYEPARASFADDVSLARHHARRGARVGFLDGGRLYRVRGYGTLARLWREWGRSIDLRDATAGARQWLDVLTITLLQGVPVPVLALAALGVGLPTRGRALLAVSAAAVGLRILLLVALRGSYARRGLAFWLSPLADPLAALRLLVSTARRPTMWRGREYCDLRMAG